MYAVTYFNIPDVNIYFIPVVCQIFLKDLLVQFIFHDDCVMLDGSEDDIYLRDNYFSTVLLINGAWLVISAYGAVNFPVI